MYKLFTQPQRNFWVLNDEYSHLTHSFFRFSLHPHFLSHDDIMHSALNSDSLIRIVELKTPISHFSSTTLFSISMQWISLWIKAARIYSWLFSSEKERCSGEDGKNEKLFATRNINKHNYIFMEFSFDSRIKHRKRKILTHSQSSSCYLWFNETAESETMALHINL